MTLREKVDPGRRDASRRGNPRYEGKGLLSESPKI